MAATKKISLQWRVNKFEKPTEYGKYEVYRAGCEKQHYETWNNTGWAYNNNDITHWRDIIPPGKIIIDDEIKQARNYLGSMIDKAVESGDIDISKFDRESWINLLQQVYDLGIKMEQWMADDKRVIWQRCPKCNATGEIYFNDSYKIPSTTGMTFGWVTCDICNGAKIIEAPKIDFSDTEIRKLLNLPEKQPEQLNWWLVNSVRLFKDEQLIYLSKIILDRCGFDVVLKKR